MPTTGGESVKMRVCMVCEGSYPYVAGGVSSWVQMLASEFKDIEFVIWSIATSKEEMNDFKYPIPDNIIEVKTVYLDDIQFEGKYKKIRLQEGERTILKSLIEDSGDMISWDEVLNFLESHRENLPHILMSKEFFDIGVDMYQKDYERTIFSKFLWNLRSMYFPLMYILSHDIPKADLYHSVSTGYAGVLGGVASYIYQKPFILTEHGIYTREREEEIIKSEWVLGVFKEIWIEFFKKLSHFAYSKAIKVTTLFDTYKTIQMELGCPEQKIAVIPNGIDYKQFYQLPRRVDKEHEFIQIGVIARVVPIKDIKTTLLAFDIAQREAPNLNLVILGPCDEDKEYYRECLTMIADMSIENVIFEGRVNVIEYLPKLDIMLLTSISEGQPLAVLEGMAAGIPQICTNVGSCSELLFGRSEDGLGEAGLIVPVMNIRAIANAIIKLAQKYKLRKRMGEVGCKRVERYYQKNIFLDQYYHMYRRIGGNESGRNRV